MCLMFQSPILSTNNFIKLRTTLITVSQIYLIQVNNTVLTFNIQGGLQKMHKINKYRLRNQLIMNL